MHHLTLRLISLHLKIFKPWFEGLKRVEQEKKIKEMRAKDKSKAIKEIHVGCNIGPHDLGVKMNKVREFLEDGHPVRVSFISKPRQLTANPLALVKLKRIYSPSI